MKLIFLLILFLSNYLFSQDSVKVCVTVNVTGTQPSNNSPNVKFNVVDYGADNTGVSDATIGVQAAINDCFTAGGGVVFFPNGTYKISGALQTSVNGTNPNSQIYIPSRSISSFGLGISITLQGESSSIFQSAYSTGINTPLPTTGVILKSTITGSGTRPSVIGTIGSSGNYQALNYVEVEINNIAIRVNTNAGTTAPTLTGINMYYAATINMDGVAVTTDVTNQLTQSPINSEVAGIIAGQKNNAGPNIISRCNVSGFKYGFILGEHTTLSKTFSIANYYGYVFPAGYYTVQGDILIHACPYGILFPNTTTMGVTKDTAFVNLNIEYEYDMPPYVTYWYASQKLLLDSGNVGTGIIRVKTATAGTGQRASILTYGGSNLVVLDFSQPDAGRFKGDNKFVTFDRTVNTVYNGYKWRTNGIDDFFLGTRETGDNDFHLFSYGTGGDVFRISKATGVSYFGYPAYVGSTTTSPSASAMLEVWSTTKGFAPPRMTTTQKNAISNPVEGLIVYDLTLHKLNVYTGSVWEVITSL